MIDISPKSLYDLAEYIETTTQQHKDWPVKLRQLADEIQKLQFPWIDADEELIRFPCFCGRKNGKTWFEKGREDDDFELHTEKGRKKYVSFYLVDYWYPHTIPPIGISHA